MTLPRLPVELNATAVIPEAQREEATAPKLCKTRIDTTPNNVVIGRMGLQARNIQARAGRGVDPCRVRTFELPQPKTAKGTPAKEVLAGSMIQA